MKLSGYLLGYYHYNLVLNYISFGIIYIVYLYLYIMV